MRIYAKFHFRDEPRVAATAGVAGDVNGFILPITGDLVWHQDSSGLPFMGRVVERIYVYRMADGDDVDGSVQVTILLERVSSLGLTLNLV